VHRHPQPLDRAGQAADQPSGVHGRAVRCVRRPQRAGCRQPGAGLVGAEQCEVVLAEAPPSRLGHLVTGPVELLRGARDDDCAALGEPAVDVLGGDHLRDLVEGRLHRAVLGDRPLLAVPRRQPGHRRGEQRRAPAAVAAARAEAGDLALEHDRRAGPGRPA
jgi:hypothetical protein